MADTAISTGAKHDADLRRRNVPDNSKSQAPATSPTLDDVKKTKPQVGHLPPPRSYNLANRRLLV